MNEETPDYSGNRDRFTYRNPEAVALNMHAKRNEQRRPRVVAPPPEDDLLPGFNVLPPRDWWRDPKE